jgi:hypothetical protein
MNIFKRIFIKIFAKFYEYKFLKGIISVQKSSQKDWENFCKIFEITFGKSKDK